MECEIHKQQCTVEIIPVLLDYIQFLFSGKIDRSYEKGLFA